jgi:methylenetetrahydrofolate dehydrogenase (NADP+)/methenyltetrahydrofolate cyclohydrolase
MSAKLIDGEALATRIKAELAAGIEAVRRKTGSPPRLASILASDNPGAKVYTRSQARSCEEGVNAREMSEHIPARKDVEGITAANLGKLFFYEPAQLIPCTAAAAYELLKFTVGDLKGAECVVVGHSPIVGKPVACLIINDLGTCTICHIGTRDLKVHTTKAEILVVAAGKAGLVRGEHVKPGATVIDVGINRIPVLDAAGQPVVDEKGKKKMKTVGDVDFDSASQVAGAITPVPGGVGPVTVAILLRNTVRAAVAQAG